MAYEKSLNKGSAFITVWVNKSKEGNDFNSYTLEKRYKDGEEWKSTSSFSENDLKDALIVINKVLASMVKERGATKEK